MEGTQCNSMDSYESTENALIDSFKAAALKVTTLYKDSLVQNRKAFGAGYQQALQDLYEFISTQPENGFLPVQELLNFAREKNNQLSFEMNKSTNNNQHTNTNINNNTVSTSNSSNQAVTNNYKSFNSGVAFEEHQHKLHSTQTPQNPIFQIDPQTQFTFAHDISLQNFRNNDGIWDQTTTTFTNNDGHKRRLVPNDINFMGRSIAFEESYSKRGRVRRDDQLVNQRQQEQMQLEQQLLQQPQFQFQ